MNQITRRSVAGVLMAVLLPAVAAAQTGGDDPLLTPAGRRALVRGPVALQVQGPMYVTAMAMGAGIGVVSGWVIDKLHNSNGPTGALVAPIVTKERKGVAFSIPF